MSSGCWQEPIELTAERSLKAAGERAVRHIYSHPKQSYYSYTQITVNENENNKHRNQSWFLEKN